MAGEPKNAAVMTSTNPNMKAMKIRIWETANLSSSSEMPFVPGAADERRDAPRREPDGDRGEGDEDPQDASARGLADRELRDRDHRSALRARGPGRRAVAGDEGEEALLERAPARADLVDLGAHRDERRDEVGTAVGVHRPDRQQVAVERRRPEPLDRRQVGRAEPGDPDLRLGLAEHVVELAAGDDPAVVDDRDAVADLLDLAQQVRVQEHRGAAVGGGADDAPDVDPADRVERGRRLVEDDERRLAEEGRRRARGAAACPSRTCRPSRPRDPRARRCPSASSAAAPRRPRGMPISSPCRVRTSRALSHGW